MIVDDRPHTAYSSAFSILNIPSNIQGIYLVNRRLSPSPTVDSVAGIYPCVLRPIGLACKYTRASCVRLVQHENIPARPGGAAADGVAGGRAAPTFVFLPTGRRRKATQSAHGTPHHASSAGTQILRPIGP
eukprot:1179730-Prorocentrum_minimum.AAC.10